MSVFSKLFRSRSVGYHSRRKPTPRRTRPAVRPARFEVLEGRMLLAALTVDGTAGAVDATLLGDGTATIDVGAVAATPGTTLSRSTAGLYDPLQATLHLKNSNTQGGGADMVYRCDAPGWGWIPLAGDWNGDGIETVGLYAPVTSMFYLRNSNNPGWAHVAFRCGPANGGWQPIAGDWNGDGVDTVGLYDRAHGTLYLKNSNIQGAADAAFHYGPDNHSWAAIAGDWNHDGVDTVGLYDPGSGSFHLKNTHGLGPAHTSFRFGPGGNAGWQPIAGDWNRNGVDTVGLYDRGNGVLHLKNRNASLPRGADVSFGYGPRNNSWTAVAGDWNKDARDSVGLYDPANSAFHLKNVNANPPNGADVAFPFKAPDGNWPLLAGDWDANGTDSVGLYDPATSLFYLKNSHSTGWGETALRFGPARAGWQPIVGDWNADGVDTVGLYDPASGAFHLKNSNSPGGGADLVFRYGPGGNRGWTAVVGDWNGDGTDSVGLYDAAHGVFHLKNVNANPPGGADMAFRFGPTGSQCIPLAGDWDANGGDSVGLYDPKSAGFHLKNANQSGGGADVTFRYGPANRGWIPLMGNWAVPIFLSATSAVPGQTLVITSGGFNPNAETQVVFTDRHGDKTLVPATAVTQTRVEVAVPPFFNTETFAFGSGTVSVSVVQQAAGGPVTFAPVAGFQIADLPDAGVAPGALTAEFLAQMLGLLDSVAEDYQRIAEASSGAVNVAPLLNHVQTLRAKYSTVQSLILPLVNQQTSRVDLGRLPDLNNLNLFVDRNGLALIDQLTAALLLNELEAGTQVATSVNRLFAPAAAPQSSQSAFDPAQTIADQFATFLDGTATEVLDFAQQYRTAGGILIAVGTVGAAFTIGAPALVAGGVLGAMWWGISTLIPAAQAAAIQGGSSVMIRGSAQLSDFEKTASFLYDSAWDSVTSQSISLVGGLQGPTGEALGTMVNIVRDVKPFYDRANPQSLRSKINQYFPRIINNLPQDDTAGITVSPTGGLETNEDGQTASFTVVLTGRPAANVTIGLSSSDTSEGTVQPTALTFTPGNWSSPRSVTVFGRDDTQEDGDVNYRIITAPATSGDPNYRGINPPDVSVVNRDNDEDDVRRFDGSYTGSWSGTAHYPPWGSSPVSGAVAFTIANRVVTVTEPGSGTGTISPSGDFSFAATGGSGQLPGVSYTFTGSIDASSGAASGGWTASFEGGTASGGWSASRHALKAAGGFVEPSQTPAALTPQALDSIAAEGIARWAAAGVDDSAIDALSRLSVQIVDLPGSHLGSAAAGAIYIDRDAAGHGWFVDPTPGDDEEFTMLQSDGGLPAVDPDALDCMDLLTVVCHELGHVVGLEDLDPSVDRLMSGTLSPGLRRQPGARELDALFAL